MVIIGAEADVCRLLVLSWLVTRGGAGDISTWHALHMLSCPVEEEADDNKIVVGVAAAILAGEGPDPDKSWFLKRGPTITGQPKGPLARMLLRKAGAKNPGMKEDLD